MKLRRTSSGEVARVLVENGQPVEYGQPLFAMRPAKKEVAPGIPLAMMFRKILIANRGEIALRVICACKELGIATVAVYSEADRNSLHVRFADEAVCIGPPRSAESYLNIPHVISAAEITDVDAIHPGYGFLSENANFAEVCEASHITFIGPSPDMLRMMGEKEQARREMAAAACPSCPAATAFVADAETRPRGSGAHRLSGDHQGLRWRRRPRHARGAQRARISRQRWRRRATRPSRPSAFPDVYLEKFIEHPRHIEFQVLGDQHGHVMHLGERECSIQRRHQKLIEESPSPAMDPKRRAGVGPQGRGRAQDNWLHQRRHRRVPDGRRRLVLLH